MKSFKNFLPLFAVALVFGLSSCDNDDDDDMDQTDPLKSMVITYEFNNGQVVPSAAYDGMHPDNLTAQMEITERTDGNTDIKVTLMNTVDGVTYNIHAHDAADPSTTPNGTPYNETPNANVFAQMLMGNGGSASVSQVANMSYASITANYEAFFVVHDPLQSVSTVDISTYVVVGIFARTPMPTNLPSQQFSYDFNTGQIAPAFAYAGSHPNTLGASVRVQGLADGTSRVSVMLDNTINGETYPVHSHDVADPATTPNGTPYDETPNGDVLAGMIAGNGGTAMTSQLSTMSFTELTTTYEGFFVVHDPLQPVTTVDPTTYVILGSFAR